jgi:hypothetical protein
LHRKEQYACSDLHEHEFELKFKYTMAKEASEQDLDSAAAAHDEAAGGYDTTSTMGEDDAEDAAAAQEGAQLQPQDKEKSAGGATETSPAQLAPASDVIDAGPPEAGGVQAAGRKRGGFSLPCFPRKGDSVGVDEEESGEESKV